MVRSRNFLPALLIGASLAACTAGRSDGSGKPAWVSNRSYYSENQPVVERTNYVLDLSTTGNGIPTSEAGRLDDWFQSLDLRYGDKIFLEDPYRNARVRADVAKVAADYGLLLSEGAPVTAGAPRPGSARVIVRRATASVPGCPNWRQAKSTGTLESTESNWGCATNSNIAAMVANPEDLVSGRRGDATGDPNAASKAVGLYRDRALSGAGGGKVEAVSTK